MTEEMNRLVPEQLRLLEKDVESLRDEMRLALRTSEAQIRLVRSELVAMHDFR